MMILIHLLPPITQLSTCPGLGHDHVDLMLAFAMTIL